MDTRGEHIIRHFKELRSGPKLHTYKDYPKWSKYFIDKFTSIDPSFAEYVQTGSGKKPIALVQHLSISTMEVSMAQYLFDRRTNFEDVHEVWMEIKDLVDRVPSQRLESIPPILDVLQDTSTTSTVKFKLLREIDDGSLGWLDFDLCEQYLLHLRDPVASTAYKMLARNDVPLTFKNLYDQTMILINLTIASVTKNCAKCSGMYHTYEQCPAANWYTSKGYMLNDPPTTQFWHSGNT